MLLADYTKTCGPEEGSPQRRRSAILMALLYGCEAWIAYQRHARKRNNLHTTSLRKLLSIKWQEKIPDTKVLNRAGMPSVYTMLMKSQLRWAGHIVCMPNRRLPKRNYYLASYKKGSAPAVRQRSVSRTYLKTLFKTFTIDLDSCEAEVQDICGWRAAVYEGTKGSKASKTHAAEQCRKARTDSVKSSAAAPIPCPHCPRLFQAKIGLTSHLHTDLTNQTPYPQR